MPILGCVRPSLGGPVADVIDKKDQFLCRICLNGNAVKPCRPLECGSPLLRGGQTNPFLHDVKDASESRRIRNAVTGRQTLSARSTADPSIRSMTGMVEPDGIEPTTSC